MKAKPKRASADVTREKILAKAKQLFMLHGFAGTSMSMIADAAEVNQSLISHHFINKNRLWITVKENLIESAQIKLINPKPVSLRAFLQEAIEQRLMIYKRSPDLLRLVTWQYLEKKSELNVGIKEAITPASWLVPLSYLQQHGMIKKDLDLKLVLIWIITTTNGILIDDLRLFVEENNKHKYMEMILSGLEKALA